MGTNTFGDLFQATTFGESHGPAMGVVIQGCPAGVLFDHVFLQSELNRRRPGRWDSSSVGVSQRKEADKVEVLSGVFKEKTLGTPIALLVRNQDARSTDYSSVGHINRRGHANDLWQEKFNHSDPRGSGRASGRETVSRVMAGAVAKMFLSTEMPQVRVKAWAQKVGPFELTAQEQADAFAKNIDDYPLRFPSTEQADKLKEQLSDLEQKHDSWGGIVAVQIQGLPVGLGEPVFKKLKSELALASLSVGATHGVSLAQVNLWQQELRGSYFHQPTNNDLYGGVRGGISTGQPVQFFVLMKPTASIGVAAQEGRHDPCILPRAIPVFEAMIHLVIADLALYRRLNLARSE